MIKNYLNKKAKSRVKAVDAENGKLLSEKRRDYEDNLVWVEIGQTNKVHLKKLIADLKESEKQLIENHKRALADVRQKRTDLEDIKTDLFTE